MAGLMLFFCVLIQWTVSETQVPSFSSTTTLLGTCVDLEQENYHLGSFFQPGIAGLVPENLLMEAYRHGLPFDINELPHVEIFAAKTTCKSEFSYRNNRFLTTSILVDYSCRGFSCLHQNLDETKRYLHHFSFLCRQRDNQFTQYSYIDPYINLSTANNIFSPTIAEAGSCRFFRLQKNHFLLDIVGSKSWIPWPLSG